MDVNEITVGSNRKKRKTGRVGRPSDKPKVVSVSDRKTELLVGDIQEGESASAVVACNDYLRMGYNRSLVGLRRHYVDLAKRKGGQARVVSLNTLYHWSWDYGWASRADAYDSSFEEDKTEFAKAVRNTGLALSHNRVIKLKQLASLLGEEIADKTKLWLYDVKQIGSGKYAEKVTLVKFNSALIDQYRGVLSDLAEETGGRLKTQRNLNMDFSDLTDDQLQQLAEGKEVTI